MKCTTCSNEFKLNDQARHDVKCKANMEKKEKEDKKKKKQAKNKRYGCKIQIYSNELY